MAGTWSDDGASFRCRTRDRIGRRLPDKGAVGTPSRPLAQETIMGAGRDDGRAHQWNWNWCVGLAESRRLERKRVDPIACARDSAESQLSPSATHSATSRQRRVIDVV